MSIVLFLQNLTQIFWSIIIVLNLYVLVLLYRVSRLYRAERFSKLEATAFLKEQIACMRSQYLNSSSSGLVSVSRGNPATAAVGGPDKNNDLLRTQLASLTNKKTKGSLRKRSRDRKDTTKRMKSLTDMKADSSSSSMHSNHSDDNPNNCHVDDQQHILYISDSYGQVIHEIPFKEQDYLEALCSVLEASHY